MAVKDQNDNGSNNTTMGSAFANAQQRGTPSNQEELRRSAHTQEQPAGMSFKNFGAMGGGAMPRNQQSEIVTNIATVLETAYEKYANKQFEIAVIPIDMNSTVSINVSVVVVALRDKTAPEIGVAYHTLILEASAIMPTPRYENINGNNVEIVRTVADAYDNALQNTVLDAVRRAFPQSKAYWTAEAEVVPREFKFDDEAALFRLATNASYAASSEIETRRSTFHDLNLAGMERDTNLTIRTTYNNNESQDAVGQPIRTDVMINFTAAMSNQTQSQQGIDRVIPIAEAGGYIDLVWDPRAPAPNPYIGMQQQQNFQRYAARFVMTKLESAGPLTIPAQLLALLSAMTLSENNQWVQAFNKQNQTISEGGLNPHDIGGIGIELNFDNNPNGVGTPIDTRADSFKMEHLHKLVASTVAPGIVISLDVPECSDQTWYNGVFAYAAIGNARANQAIIDGANTLTNGAFANYFAPTGRVAVEDSIVHTGWYVDRDGNKRDLREVDYLYVLNKTGMTDPNVIRLWSDSFNNTGRPVQLRLADRKKIIEGFFSQVKFTGFARRISFENDFIKALVSAFNDCQLPIRSISPFADMGNFERATAGFVNHTLVSGEPTGMFNRGGFGQQNNFSGFNRSFGSRW